MISKKRDFKLVLGINGEDGWNSSLCIPVSQGIGYYHNNYGNTLPRMSLRFQVAGQIHCTTSRQGIKWVVISFGFTFVLFSCESSWGPRPW